MTTDEPAGKTAVCLLLSALSLLLITAGCEERSSPAATATVSASAAQPNKNIDAPSVDAPAPAANTADSSTSSTANQAVHDIGFDNIKFDMQKDAPFKRTMITPAIEKISNSKIRIRGYILPSFQQTGISQFVLVRDNMQCCFGPGAALYDCIVVQMDGGHTTDFTTRPVAVEGTFSIQEIASPEGKCLAIYHMQADNVQ